MSLGTAPSQNVYLTRAYSLVKEAEKQVAVVRQRAVTHNPQTKTDPPLQWLAEDLFALALWDKLTNDLELASQQIEQAVAIDPNASIATPEGSLNAAHLRSRILIVSAQVWLVDSNTEFAQTCLNSSLQIAESPYAHYLFGLLHECRHEFADALRHFERALEMEPVGDLSLPALREAHAMRIAVQTYKKSFRGSWNTFWLLLIFFWPAAIVYFIRKRK